MRKLGILAILFCLNACDAGDDSPATPTVDGQPVMQWTAALNAPTSTLTVPFRDSSTFVDGSNSGKSDGTWAIGTDGNMYVHVRFSNTPRTKTGEWMVEPSNEHLYDASCNQIASAGWTAIANYNVATSVTYCGNYGLQDISLGLCPNSSPYSSGTYAPVGDGDGTGQRTGIMALNSAGGISSWYVYVKKTADTRGGMGGLLGSCQVNGGFGPMNVGQFGWMQVQ